MKKLLYFIIPILTLAMIWEIISRSGLVSISIFPPPSHVLEALWGMIKTKTLFIDIRDSLWRLILGLFLGSVVGVFIGLLTGRIKKFSLFIVPIIQSLRPIPPVALIPLVIVWFGIDNPAKIFSISFAVFFIVWINTHIGAGQIPQIFLWSARQLTSSAIKIFRSVIFPATLPFIIAGIRTGVAMSFIMIFVSELAGASSGLGYRISVAHASYRIDEMMASLIVLGALGAVTDQLFVFVTRKLFPWIKLI